MSRFDNAIFILQTTGHPLFAMMAQTRQPLVMAKGTANTVVAALPPDMREEDQRVVGQAITNLAQSMRYLQACTEPGVMRHDLAGNPVEPVSDEEMKWAASRIKRKTTGAERQKERDAAAKAKRKPKKAIDGARTSAASGANT